MNNKVFLTSFFCLFTLYLFSQEKIENSKNNIFIEAGGPGGYGSINYEYLFDLNQKIKFSGRVGLGTYKIIDFKNSFNPDITMPLSVSCFYGGNHNLELGIGETFSSIVYVNSPTFEVSRSTMLNTFFILGYRYQKEINGLMFRIAYTPVLEQNVLFKNWLGISIGKTF